MNIAIIGYGKMGRVIERMALARNHTIVAKITSKNSDFSSTDIKQADVAIIFSIPEATVSNINTCFNAKVPAIVGNTGWLGQFAEITHSCTTKKGGLFYASNFSIGMNIFFKINILLARLMNSQDYEVSIEEIHHLQKLDSPSGTAISLANQISNKLDRKTTWTKGNILDNKAILINSKRIIDTPGTHIVSYENVIDKIDITHTAKGREGFALGAILASEFMVGKKGIYNMEDLFK